MFQHWKVSEMHGWTIVETSCGKFWQQNLCHPCESQQQPSSTCVEAFPQPSLEPSRGKTSQGFWIQNNHSQSPCHRLSRCLDEQHSTAKHKIIIKDYFFTHKRTTAKQQLKEFQTINKSQKLRFNYLFVPIVTRNSILVPTC